MNERLHFPDGNSQLVGFILRDNKLFSFHNLKDPRGPFRDVINQKGVETIRSEQWWDDPEGHRRYVTLLNRGLYKFAARKGGPVRPGPQAVLLRRPEGGPAPAGTVPPPQRQDPQEAERRLAAQEQGYRPGEELLVVSGLAAGLAFLQVDKRQGCFCIRPERHLTSDGVTPLPPKQIGRRGCLYDLVSLSPTSDARLLRAGQYPPLRGTLFSVGAVSYLYTTGYLPALGKYPHGHVPSPLRVADHVGDTTPAELLREVMVLTKMNWNSANMAGLLPITLRFCRLVGDVLREVPADREPEPKYKFYLY